MVFVGIDLHKQYSYVVVLNAHGDVLDERRLVNSKVATYIAGLAEPVHVTLEATFSWQAMVEQLEEKVAEVGYGNGECKIIRSTPSGAPNRKVEPCAAASERLAG